MMTISKKLIMRFGHTQAEAESVFERVNGVRVNF